MRIKTSFLAFSLTLFSSILIVFNITFRCSQAMKAQSSPILECASVHRRLLVICEKRSQYEAGLVSHSLISAIRKILKQFSLLVTQLFQQIGELTLHKLGFLVSNSSSTLSFLLSFFLSIPPNCKGGELLNELILYHQNQGDPISTSLFSFLLKHASDPYYSMVNRWLVEGVLEDPFNEFMVGEDLSLRKEEMGEDFNAQYWTKRYFLKDRHIPSSLSTLSERILTTGKYLNVLKECGKPTPPPPPDFSPLSYSLPESSTHSIISTIFSFSSQFLLNIFLEDYDIVRRLESLKSFFFMGKGDYFENFLETAEEQLRKPVNEIGVGRIDSLLQMAIQMSAACNDPYKEDVTCIFAPFNLIQHLGMIHSWGSSNPNTFSAPSSLNQSLLLTSFLSPGTLSSSSVTSSNAMNSSTITALKGIEAFMLNISVSWPMSIIITRRAITKYQLIFRLLFFAKHVEKRLHLCWLVCSFDCFNQKICYV